MVAAGLCNENKMKNVSWEFDTFAFSPFLRLGSLLGRNSASLPVCLEGIICSLATSVKNWFFV